MKILLGETDLFAFGLFKHLVKLNFLFILRVHAALFFTFVGNTVYGVSFFDI